MLVSGQVSLDQMKQEILEERKCGDPVPMVPSAMEAAPELKRSWGASRLASTRPLAHDIFGSTKSA